MNDTFGIRYAEDPSENTSPQAGYAEGVTFSKPRVAQRTLGKDPTRITYAKGVTQNHRPRLPRPQWYNVFGVDGWAFATQGALRDPGLWNLTPSA